MKPCSTRLALLVALALASPARSQCPLTTLSPSAGEEGDLFGYAVSASGERLVAGAPGEDGPQSTLPLSGAAYVYERRDGQWAEIAQLRASDADVRDRFGHSVATNGDLVLCGAPFDGNTGPGVFTGAAYVFEPAGGTFVETAKLSPVGGRLFGYSLAVSGDVAFVGALDPSGTSGFVSVYEQVAGTWTETQRITSPAAGFAQDVAADGGTLVVGAPGAGLALVYEPVAGTWTERARLTTAGVFANVAFSVAIRDDVIAVGAPAGSAELGIPSEVMVYERPAGGWVDATQTARLSSTIGIVLPLLGASVAVGASSIVAAAPGEDRSASGAFVFFEEPLTGWVDAFEDDQVFLTGSAVPSGFDVPHDLVDLAGSASFLGEPLATILGTEHGSVDVRVGPDVESYCTAKLDSAGCLPTISAQGVASLSDPVPFTVDTIDVLNQKNGLYFYATSAPAALPFLGGTLCVLPPIRRTPVASTGGGPPPDDCSGTLSFDFNAWIQQGNEPGLEAGDTVWGQTYYRDPTGSFGAGLSGGIAYAVCP